MINMKNTKGLHTVEDNWDPSEVLKCITFITIIGLPWLCQVLWVRGGSQNRSINQNSLLSEKNTDTAKGSLFSPLSNTVSTFIMDVCSGGLHWVTVLTAKYRPVKVNQLWRSQQEVGKLENTIQECVSGLWWSRTNSTSLQVATNTEN